MRNILFRGKQMTNDEWIEGIAFPHDLESCTMLRQSPLDGSLEGKEVLIHTVGQYSGLTDKNGLRIFEGDVLERKPGERFLVQWSEEYARFELLSQSGAVFNMTIQWQCELLGNIHDDPWLFHETREAEEEDKQC